MKAQTVFQRVQGRFDPVAAESAAEGNGLRRMAHGGSAWSLPRGLNGLRQPQDGASPTLATISADTASPLAALKPRNNPFEAEDAGMTGGTRSLSRRLMGLNVTAAPRKPATRVAPVMAQRQVA